MVKLSKRDQTYAWRARRVGVPVGWSSLVIKEANEAKIPRSLAFALVQTESQFRNVYGHDPVKSAPKGATVTKANYKEYKQKRKAGLGMQGVGPCQLTWYAFQDEADALGGCWIPRYNMRVAFKNLKQLIKQYGYSGGIRRYNGSGPDAVRYSATVRRRARSWKLVLLGVSKRYPA